MGAVKVITSTWFGQLRSKGVQYFLIAFLAALVCFGFYTAKITKDYIFNKWTESAQLADVVVGFKGSPLQIVASTLFRLENPTGNLDSASVAYWKAHPLVSDYCTVSLGDNIEGYPLIGTSASYFDWTGIEVVQGHLPQSDEDVVLDEQLAEELGLTLGAHLHPSHGSDTNGESHDHHHFNIVGIVRADRAADQKVFFTTPKAYYGMHEGKGNGDVTAIMLRVKRKSALVMLPRMFENRPNEQGAFPVFIFAQLQKQWTPTLRKMETYSIVLPLVLLVMFVLIIRYLASTERTTVGFMKLQKVPYLPRFFGAYGLIVCAVLLGVFMGLLVLHRLGSFYEHKELGWSLMPLAASLFTLLIPQKK